MIMRANPTAEPRGQRCAVRGARFVAPRTSHLTPFALLACVATMMSAQQPVVRVQAGVSISKDTVTVGEPFDVRIRVRAPADARIMFPDNPDTSGAVQARDPRVIVTSDSVQSLDQTATYRLAAWDIGVQPVRIGNVTVASPTATNDDERRVNLATVEVFVRSVLPADSALRVPKPARAIWEIPAFPWWILAALLAATAIGLGIWWWLKRRRQPRPAVPVDPYLRARKEFSRLDAMGLVDAGERTRFVALVVEVLRDYMAARYPDAALSLTSRELVAIVRRHPHVPGEQLSRVLHEADLAKFAAFALSEERARGLARDAKSIVEHEHQAMKAAEAAQAAAANARAAA